MSVVADSLAAALQTSKLDAVLRCDDLAAWDRAWQALPHQAAPYGAPMTEYQLAYFRGAGWVLDDISLVLRHDGLPCGLWPLALGRARRSARLCSNGAP